MAYVITDTCTKDELCVEACPVDCIHPKKDEAGFEELKHLMIDPEACIDCGACVPVCPNEFHLYPGRVAGRTPGGCRGQTLPTSGSKLPSRVTAG